MGRSTPESFEKRQRDRRKKQKREEKLMRRLIRNEEKKAAKDEPTGSVGDAEASERSESAEDERPPTPLE